ncbi:trans-resveratrol di-O-methyltransferase-like [Cucumis melo var. makuwa]|uniref:Trans-resveratrol di-O-methyltransferase-like n=1 Tax=Cucumis melo var. makuwa TaxID=1194695 RepID=A0A5D3DD88_CUCMM|nr:trans-resveratrol di-O-methyltransferase-like [Cucumis melo var. makuwa]TYK21637.1 trans-resveratrol di-O-methyltransferase-like [Cucumis melo var. makuwa]
MNMEGGKKLAMGGDELLEAQSHIWNHIFNFINSMSLKCAIQLGIPDAIHSHGPNPMPLSLLVSSLQLHPNKTQSIYRLMRLLTHSGFFVLKEEGYVLTNSSHLLLKDNPCTLSPFILSMLESAFVEPSHFLSAWFRTDDQTPFETAHGMSFWEFVGNKQKDGDIFNAGMASDARLVMSVLIGKHKSVFEGVESLVDIGGGTGTMTKAIAKAFPQIECTVLDLPQVVAELKSDIPNFKYVEGDMFDAIPPADALLLKWILHDWSDEECVKILKKCKEAITSNGNKGKVMVIDLVLFNKKNDQDSIETQLFHDMLMMVVTGGKEREEKEWAKLIKEAGFSAYKIFPILGLRSLIEIYP